MITYRSPEDEVRPTAWLNAGCMCVANGRDDAELDDIVRSNNEATQPQHPQCINYEIALTTMLGAAVASTQTLSVVVPLRGHLTRLGLFFLRDPSVCCGLTDVAKNRPCAHAHQHDNMANIGIAIRLIVTSMGWSDGPFVHI